MFPFKMKVLSLNIRHGGGKQVQCLLDWTICQAPDVVVYPEWRNNAPGQKTLHSFEAQGFKTATACRDNPGANGVLIAAKQFSEPQRVTPGISKFGELLLAEIYPGFRMLAGYFPQGKLKEPFFRQCMNEVSRAGEVPIFLIGDLNTGRNDLDIEGGGTPFDCADLFEGLESRAGLIDLWRATNGNRQEWTWRSMASGFRIDHAFGNKPLLERFGPIVCRYDHAPRETKITDHSALFVELSA